MKVPPRLLLVEDSEEDARFLLRELKRDGYELASERVGTLEDVAAALEGEEWDIVVCDYFLPEFTAPEALMLLREKGLDLPFIVVSGAVGEEKAVEAMRAGAHDYVMKHNLARLGPAIERELREAEVRREKRLAEEALRKSEERYKLVAEGASDGIWEWDARTGAVYWNDRLFEILGLSRSEFTPTLEAFVELVHPEDRQEVMDAIAARLEEGAPEHEVPFRRELRMRHRTGEYRYCISRGKAQRDRDGTLLRMAGLVMDVTEHRRAEEALKESEEQYRATFELAAVGMAHVSLLGRFLRVNDKLCETLGYEREELLRMGYEQVTHPEDLDNDAHHVRRVLEGGLRSYSVEKRYLRKDGSVIWVCLGVSLARARKGATGYLISAFQDIHERKLAELVPEPLTPQEFAVLKLITRGRTNREISDDLTYSYGGIKLHVRNVLAKLGVKSREEAATRAVEIGLLPPAPREPRGFTREAG